MNAMELLTELRQRGIRIQPLPNGNLGIRPKSLLTPELVEQARQHKLELLAHLRCLEVLRALGGEVVEPDESSSPELREAVALIVATFPGCRLVVIRSRCLQ